MIDPAIIDAMLAAGATAEVIAAAVKADHAIEAARLGAKREKNRDRMRVVRERACTDMHNDARARTSPSPPSPPSMVSPITPSLTTPSPTPSSQEARKRASRLPSDWKPDEKAKEYARMRGLTAHEIDVQAEKFRNYWLAKSGRSATKFDWDRTWQNWIIDTAEKLGRASLPTGGVAPADLTPAQKEDWAHGWRPGMPTSDELRAKYGGQNGAAAADRLEETSPVDEGGKRLRGEEPGLSRGGSRH